MSSFMLALLLVVFGLAVFGITQYRDGSSKTADKGKESKEKFKAEAETDADTDAEIAEVAEAFREARGTAPTAGEVRRAIKAMRRTGQSAEEAVDDIVNKQRSARDEPRPAQPQAHQAQAHQPQAHQAQAQAQAHQAQPQAHRTQPQAQAHQPQPQPHTDQPWQKPSTAPPRASPDPCLDASILRRVEDELESVVTRIDGLLEEIQLMKSRVVSGPLTDGSVASYVPYHPV